MVLGQSPDPVISQVLYITLINFIFIQINYFRYCHLKIVKNLIKPFFTILKITWR